MDDVIHHNYHADDSYIFDTEVAEANSKHAVQLLWQKIFLDPSAAVP